MPGILMDGYVAVEDQSEGSRLYGRGNYGYPRRGGGVDLDLIEAVYLLESRRLDVRRRDGSVVTYPELFRLAAGIVEGFDIKYAVFRDLRGRGLLCKFESGDYDISVFPVGGSMSNSRPEYMVRAVSERNPVDIDEFLRGAKDTDERSRSLMYGVVDEDGDVVYYTVSIKDPSGRIYPVPMDGRPVGYLIRDRVFVFDRSHWDALRDYGFYGTSGPEVLQLSLLEAAHLVGKGRLTVLDNDDSEMGFDRLMEAGASMQKEFRDRYMVYTDLRARGLVVKTGFKFGTHFRAYEQSPDDTHARYLVHAVSREGLRAWSDISRTVRLSVGVKKEILFGLVRRNAVDYLQFDWVRPGNVKPGTVSVPKTRKGRGPKGHRSLRCRRGCFRFRLQDGVQEPLEILESRLVEEVDVVVAVPAGGDEPSLLHPAYGVVRPRGVHSEQAVREGRPDLLLREAADHGHDILVREGLDDVELRIGRDPHRHALREADVPRGPLLLRFIGHDTP